MYKLYRDAIVLSDGMWNPQMFSLTSLCSFPSHFLFSRDILQLISILKKLLTAYSPIL